jgi:hypothetical protein
MLDTMEKEVVNPGGRHSENENDPGKEYRSRGRE